ncbi:hypothetical protein LJK88_07750 [Paenibacillus sp. P26]|nr:hypothetical protein LJK88_07750 [Paenibacillus sp. P26]
MTSTASFSLAMESQSHMAGSASALLGLLAVSARRRHFPLVGVAGEYSAVPMGVILVSTSLLALLAYFGLAQKSRQIKPVVRKELSSQQG